MTYPRAALVEEAARKSGLLWLDLPGLPQPRAAWHIWHDGAAYVLTGGEGEQPLPGLPEAERVTVTLRGKDKGGRLITFVAACEQVRPGDELWDAVTPLLARERLNAASHEGLVERWADDVVISSAGSGNPRVHDAGYLLFCATANSTDSAVFTDPGFRATRQPVMRALGKFASLARTAGP